jgi:hypothetical protein
MSGRPRRQWSASPPRSSSPTAPGRRRRRTRRQRPHPRDTQLQMLPTFSATPRAGHGGNGHTGRCTARPALTGGRRTARHPGARRRSGDLRADWWSLARGRGAAAAADWATCTCHGHPPDAACREREPGRSGAAGPERSSRRSASSAPTWASPRRWLPSAPPAQDRRSLTTRTQPGGHRTSEPSWPTSGAHRGRPPWRGWGTSFPPRGADCLLQMPTASAPTPGRLWTRQR